MTIFGHQRAAFLFHQAALSGEEEMSRFFLQHDPWNRIWSKESSYTEILLHESQRNFRVPSCSFGIYVSTSQSSRVGHVCWHIELGNLFNESSQLTLVCTPSDYINVPVGAGGLNCLIQGLNLLHVATVPHGFVAPVDHFSMGLLSGPRVIPLGLKNRHFLVLLGVQRCPPRKQQTS